MSGNRIFAATALALGLLATSARAQTYSPAVGRSVGGDPFNDASYVQRGLTAVGVWSASSVNAIQFVYADDGPKHGGDRGYFHGETIASDEFIGAVTVTYDNMVDSVQFHIYRKVEGGTPIFLRSTERFGNSSTYTRTIRAPAGSEIFGSYGRAGRGGDAYMDNLGFCFRPWL